MRTNTFGFSSITAVAAIVVIIIAAVIYFNTAGSPDAASNQGADKNAMTQDDAMMDGLEMMEDGDVVQDDSMMQDEDEMMEGEDSMMEPDDTMMKDDAMQNDSIMHDDDLSFSGTVLAGAAAKLIDYNKADYEKALASDKLAVLYFYANWCPVCKEETTAALYPAFNELSGSSVVGFRVNFDDSDTDDDEIALAREFGVAYQHTKVFVKNNKRVLKSPESWDKERYAREIEKAL